MSNEISTVTTENVNDVIEELNKAFYDIPFENSAFQTENFVIAGSITPARAYRSIGLRMMTKLNALREAKYSRMRMDIDIEELQEKINNPNTSKFDRRRAEIDIQEKLESLPYTNKLINDAITELNLLYAHFKALPKYTREQFEKEEAVHFEQRLQRQIQGKDGAVESLINMQHDIKNILGFEENFKLTGENDVLKLLETPTE
ncbi:MAG: hypothetical protein QXN55_00190 [Candidatus Nitrosotenuis sp.]